MACFRHGQVHHQRRASASGMRTKEDWHGYSGSSRKPLRKTTLVEWAIEEDEDIEETEDRRHGHACRKDSPRPQDAKADTRTLPELLIENRHDILIERIGTRLKTHATETDIARLYIALVEYRFMRKCPIKTFRNALQRAIHMN